MVRQISQKDYTPSYRYSILHESCTRFVLHCGYLHVPTDFVMCFSVFSLTQSIQTIVPVLVKQPRIYMPNEFVMIYYYMIYDISIMHTKLCPYFVGYALFSNVSSSISTFLLFPFQILVYRYRGQRHPGRWHDSDLSDLIKLTFATHHWPRAQTTVAYRIWCQ